MVGVAHHVFVGRWQGEALERGGDFPLTEFLRSRYLVFRVTGIPDRKAKMSLFAWKTGMVRWTVVQM